MKIYSRQRTEIMSGMVLIAILSLSIGWQRHTELLFERAIKICSVDPWISNPIAAGYSPYYWLSPDKVEIYQAGKYIIHTLSTGKDTLSLDYWKTSSLAELQTSSLCEQLCRQQQSKALTLLEKLNPAIRKSAQSKATITLQQFPPGTDIIDVAASPDDKRVNIPTSDH